MLRRVVLIAGVVAVLGSVAATASAQGFRGGMSGRGAGAMLLAMPEVQKELNLNDDQAKQVNTLLTDTREKLQSSFGRINFQELQNLSDEERQQRFNEMRKKAEEVTKGIDEKINQILDAKQTQRLSQLQLQREGAMALARPEVAKKLNLTEEQQAKIKQIQEAAHPRGGTSTATCPVRTARRCGSSSRRPKRTLSPCWTTIRCSTGRTCAARPSSSPSGKASAATALPRRRNRAVQASPAIRFRTGREISRDCPNFRSTKMGLSPSAS